MADVVEIVTACFDGFDRIRPQVAQDIDVDFTCHTDDPDLEAPAPWRVKVERPRFKHPCLAAKVYKCLRDSRTVIWIDANVEITSPSFAREALEAINDGIAVYRHPRRDCIYDEAEASLGAEAQGGKYAGQPLLEQVGSYRAGGHPEHAGLFACGVIAWDGADPSLGTQWLAECVRWSFQDQLSFPVVCRRLGITPGVFDHAQLDRRYRGPAYIGNRWLRLHPHLR